MLVQPDVFVITRDAARSLTLGSRWDVVRELPLAIEVISPSSRRYDRFKKRVLYQRQDVPLYWVVDPEKQSAEEWTPTLEFPRIQRERLVWHPEGASEPLVIALAELFAEP